MVGFGVSTLNINTCHSSNRGRWVYMILSFSIFHFFKVDVYGGEGWVGGKGFDWNWMVLAVGGGGGGGMSLFCR